MPNVLHQRQMFILQDALGHDAYHVTHKIEHVQRCNSILHPTSSVIESNPRTTIVIFNYMEIVSPQ